MIDMLFAVQVAKPCFSSSVPFNDVAAAKNRHAPTSSTQKFDQLFSVSKGRKKPCHLKVRHN